MIRLSTGEMEHLHAELYRVHGALFKAEEYALMLLARMTALEYPGVPVVEIGSYCGRSAIAISRGCSKGERVICIDPFWGFPSDEFDCYEAFKANVTHARVSVELHKTTSRLAAEKCLNNTIHNIRLLFIDGDHTYEEAKFDYEVWGRYVTGYIAIHDVYNTAVHFPGVDRLWEEIDDSRKVALIDYLGVIRCP